MLERAGDPNNRRELLVSLTEAGRERLRACNALVDGIETEMFSDLDKKTHAQFRTILETVIGTIRRTDK